MRLWRLPLVISMGLISLPSSAGLEQAMDCYRAGKFHEAASEFSALIEKSPEYAYGHFMLANAMAQLGNLDEAVARYRRAIELDGAKFEYHVNLANACAKQLEWTEVVSILDQALPLASEAQAPILYRLRGGAYAQLGDWARAVADLERAAPGSRVLETLGLGYLKLGDDRAAAQTLAQVAAAEPQNAEARALATEAQLNVAADASDGDTKKLLYAEALRTAEEYARLEPGTFEADYLVGRAALGAGDFDLARSSLTAALAKKPDHCYAMINRGRALMGEEDWVNAFEAFDAATRCNATRADAWENKAYSLQKQERLEEAIEAYERALTLGSESSFVQENLRIRRTNLEVREHNRAMTEAERAQQEEAARVEREYQDALRQHEERERRRKGGDR